MKNTPTKNPQFSIAQVMANEVSKKMVHGFIEEIVLHKNHIKDANSAIKDIKEQANTSLGIPGKLLNKMVKEYLDDGSIEGEILALEEAKELSDIIFKT